MPGISDNWSCPFVLAMKSPFTFVSAFRNTFHILTLAHLIMDEIIIKCTYQGDLRRFTVSQQISFAALKTMLCNLYKLPNVNIKVTTLLRLLSELMTFAVL